MKSESQKFSSYVLLFALCTLVMLIITASVAILGIDKVLNGTDAVRLSREKNEAVASVRLALEKTRNYSTIGDPAGLQQAGNALLESVKQLDIYITTVEEKKLTDALSDKLSEYHAALLQTAEGEGALPQELYDTAQEIDSQLQEVSMLIHDLAEATDAEAENVAKTFIIMLITLTVTAVVVMLLASIAVIAAIKKTLTDDTRKRFASFLPTEDSNDRLQFSELETCVNDLKAVTYDLQQAAKAAKK